MIEKPPDIAFVPWINVNPLTRQPQAQDIVSLANTFVGCGPSFFSLRGGEVLSGVKTYECSLFQSPRSR